MAAVTSLGSNYDSTSGAHSVTATPAVNDLIVIWTANDGNTSAATPTDNNSDGLGTYTTIVTCVRNVGADTGMWHIRNALVGSATSTVFTHNPGVSTGGGLNVLKATGMTRTGASAALQSAKEDNIASGLTPAPVFPAVPQSGNPVVGAVQNATNPATMTPRASPAYTERVDLGHAAPVRGIETMSIDSGETSATITWGSTSGSGFGDAVVELDTSALVALVAWIHRNRIDMSHDGLVLETQNAEAPTVSKASPYSSSRTTPLWQVPRLLASQAVDATSAFTPALLTQKILQVFMDATSAFAAAMTKLPVKVLAATSAFTPAVQKLVSKTLAASSAFTAVLNRLMNQVLAATSSFAPALQTAKVFQKVLDAVSTFTPVVTTVVVFKRTLAATGSFLADLATLFIPGGPGGGVVARIVRMRRNTNKDDK